VFEPTESFNFNLSSPTGATIADGTGVITITDNDSTTLPTLSVNDPTVSENGGNLVYTVTLSAASTSSVTVAYSTAPGTATAGTDYTTQTGTLTIPAGQTSGTISVPILNDSAVEPNETVLLNLTNPTGATIADAQGSGTITNDDQASAPTLAVSDVTVSEGGAALVTVSLSGPATGPVSVAYGTAPGSAVAGSDYTSLTGTLNFATGETSKTVSVTTINDTVFEPTESFNFNLSSPTGATIADGTGVITITDNDSTTTPSPNPAVVAIHNTTLYKAGDPTGYGSGDPSGLAYVPGLNLLFIADSEHDEAPYNSPTNLFAVRPDGTHVASYSLTSFCKEPTGLAYNPKNGCLYITDDDTRNVFWVDPNNPTVKLGQFSVRGLGMTDPEDPKFDPITGNMYMLDGFSRTFFELTPTGGLVRKFVLPSVMTDAEALAYDASHDVFFVASGATRGTIFEMDHDGNVLATINTLNSSTYSNPITGSKPKIKGLELAPSSNPNDDPGHLSLYAADYGVDQQPDGRLFELDLGAGWFIA
jgi:Calx-beta domain